MGQRPLNEAGRKAQAEYFRRNGDAETAAAVLRGEVEFDPEALEADPRNTGGDTHGSHPPRGRRR